MRFRSLTRSLLARHPGGIGMEQEYAVKDPEWLGAVIMGTMLAGALFLLSVVVG
jgi:hypothetical protein